MFANVDNDGCIRQCRKSKIAVIVTFMFAFCMFVVACSFLHVHCWIVCELYQSCSSLRGHVRPLWPTTTIANCWSQNVSAPFVSSKACEIIPCKLLIAKCICAIRLFEGMWDYSLQIVDCKLLFAKCICAIVSSRACEIIHCKLLIAKCICAIRLFEGMWDHSSQIVDCNFLIANCWLQTVDCKLLIANCWLVNVSDLGLCIIIFIFASVVLDKQDRIAWTSCMIIFAGAYLQLCICM